MYIYVRICDNIWYSVEWGGNKVVISRIKVCYGRDREEGRIKSKLERCYLSKKDKKGVWESGEKCRSLCCLRWWNRMVSNCEIW